MSDSESLQSENDDLRRRLADAQESLRAVMSGEVDAVAMEGGATPVLLRDAQESVLRSLRLMRAIFDGAVDPMLLVDDHGVYVDANPAACELFGLPRERLLGLHLGDFAAPGQDALSTHVSLQRTGQMRGQLRIQRRGGGTRTLEYGSTADVAAGLHLSVLRDVTDRMAAEEALRRSEARYRRIIESTSEGVWLSDAAYVTTFVNQRMAEMLGYERQELVGQTVFMLVRNEDREASRFRLDGRRLKTLEASDSYQHAYRRKDGTTCWALVKVNAVFDIDGNYDGVIALLTDVTEQRELEVARNRLASIVASSEDAILSVSLDGTITSWNASAERMFQYSADEVVGKPIFLIVPSMNLENERHTFESIVLTRAVHRLESTRRRKDGSSFEVAMTVSPVRDAEGKVIGLSEIIHDLTQQRKTEASLRRTEDQFRQAQKMEAVGRLAGGVAHDFNNVLSVILSYASLVSDELKPSDPMRADVQEIAKAGRRATDLTRQLLAFSRQQVLQPRVLELTKVVDEMKPMLRRLLGEHIELTILTNPRAGRILADAGQIEQVIMNLAVNARDAMPDGGKLTVETTNVTLDEEYVGAHVGVTPGEYVLLAVSDTGIGMDAETRARIFEPFFTTKEKGKGTGLGLSTVFGIVEQSNGHVWVYSEVGAGTTFKIYLPRTDRRVSGTMASVSPQPMTRGSETLLLVEDEEDVRTVACVILRRNGYHVLEASNGGEALLVSKDFRGKIHLLLTDVVMPRMSGRRLAEALAEERPEMKVVFASGYTDDAIIHHGVLDAGVAFLQKPFTPAGLLRKVRETLDGIP